MARRRSSSFVELPPIKQTASNKEEEDDNPPIPVLQNSSSLKKKEGMKKEEGEIGDENPDGAKDCFQWEKIVGIGIILTLIKCGIKGVTDIIVKKFVGINPVALIFYRSIIILTLLMPLSIFKDQPPFPTKLSLQDRLLLVFRSVIGFLQVMANFFALHQMPVGIVKMIISTKPVFTIIFARIFLKETCDILDAISMLLMLGGVVIVLEPWKMTDTDAGYGGNFQIATILLFISTIMASNIGIILRKFKNVGFISLSSSREIIYIILTFWMIFTWSLDMPLTTLQNCWMFLSLGVCGLLTATLNIFALKVEEAGRIALVDRCSSIIIGFIIQIEIFNEVPSNLAWVGVGVVMVATIIIGIKKILKKRKKANQSEK